MFLENSRMPSSSIVWHSRHNMQQSIWTASTESKGAWASELITCPVTTAQAKSISILHKISQHVICVSNLYHDLLLSAPIETVYVPTSVKNTLHTCRSSQFFCVTWHAKHMKSNYSNTYTSFVCLYPALRMVASLLPTVHLRAVFFYPEDISNSAVYLKKSFHFTASTSMKIKILWSGNIEPKKSYVNTRTLSKHLYKQNS